jgi:mono/diheme cytochrome c family protein
MRRPLVTLIFAIAAVGVFAGGLAWLLDVPQPPPGAPRAQRLYYALCATCHGVDGRGSWRALLFMIRPGDLTDGARMSDHSDRYLFDLIKQGGAPIGRPGMPAFGYVTDADVQALVQYVRQLAATSRARSRAGPPAH